MIAHETYIFQGIVIKYEITNTIEIQALSRNKKYP